MKRALLAIFLVGFSFHIISAQGPVTTNPPTAPTQETDSILLVLKKIRDLQVEERDQRMKAVHHRDSLNKKHNTDSTEAIASEYSVMSDVERNTRFNFWANGWNLIGVFALLVAIWSLVISKKTFRAQSDTEKHTQNAPIQAQIGVLKDLPRHFYRNLACTCAAFLKFRDEDNIDSSGNRKQYPSEANILKLTTLPDEFILPIDSTDASVYQKMHEEKLLFKNYNMEVNVAAEHFSEKNISDESLKNDYDNLLFKPFYLTSRMFELQDRIKDRYDAEGNAPYAIYAFVKEHLEKVKYSTLLSNKNGELATLKKISSNEAFINAIGVKKDSISRGLEALLKYKKTDPDIVSFLRRERDKENEFKGTGKIDCKDFRAFFASHYEKEEPEKKRGIDYLNKLRMVVDADSFCQVFEIEDITKKAKNEFFKAMYFYFDFFRKEDWGVEELVLTILKVDTVLELSKIGMIDY